MIRSSRRTTITRKNRSVPSFPLYHTVTSPKKSHKVFKRVSMLAVLSLCAWLSLERLYVNSYDHELYRPSFFFKILPFQKRRRRVHSIQELLEQTKRSEAALRQQLSTRRIGEGYSSYERDAFGTALLRKENNNSTNTNNSTNSTLLFWEHADGLRDRFMERYGVELQVRALLQQGLSGNTLDEWIRRLLFQTHPPHHTPLTLLIIGHRSVLHNSDTTAISYPTLIEKFVGPLVQHALGRELHVRTLQLRNDVVPEHPWAWRCTFEDSSWNVSSSSPDVVLWDLTGATDSIRNDHLEPILRRYYTDALPLVRGIATQEHYQAIRGSFLQHPTLLLDDTAAAPFVKLPANRRPDGFQSWPRRPQPDTLHPAQHELIAWLVAMHFLGALELLMAEEDTLSTPPPKEQREELMDPPSPDLLYCSTTVEFFTVTGHNMTREVPLSSSRKLQALQILSPQIKESRRQRWVFQEDPRNKLSKRRQRQNGAVAFFGVAASGTLRFRLPRTVSALVVCSLPTTTTTTTTQGECQLAKDVQLQVNGVLVETTSSKSTSCVHGVLQVPGSETTLVEINVVNPAITWIRGPCSIAHIIGMA
jgi:hypothetical protein